MKIRQIACSCCVPLLALVIVSTASAVSDIWNTNSSGNFTDASNWSGRVPVAGDQVFFNRGGGVTYTVTLPGQATAFGPKNYASDEVSIGSNNVTFAQSSPPLSGPSIYTVSTLVMGAPPAAPSILNTSLADFSTTTAILGLGTGSPATLNVNAHTFEVTGSTADFELSVGSDANGTVTVANGSLMSVSGTSGNAVLGKNAGITGTVNITGPGSTWDNSSQDATAPLAVGGLGTGALNITLGGQADDFDASIAQGAGSSGTVTVNGAGSQWTNRDKAIVGDGGTGLLQVTNGALVTDSTLIVGGTKTGTLTIASGGVVNDASAVIGSDSTAAGAVSVSGTGSKWSQTGNLQVGGNVSVNSASADGSLHVAAGAQVATGGDANVASAGHGSVRLEDSGSQWNVGGATNLGTGGTLDVLAGAFATTNTATISGVVEVDDANATWNIKDYLAVNRNSCLGFGCTTLPSSVSVGDGAHINTRVTQIDGPAYADGFGTTWSTAEQLYVGLVGAGTFMVTGPAMVTSGTVEMGVAPKANGTASVSGGAWTNSGDFAVGVAGTAKLTVEFGGQVSVGGLLTVGPHGTVEGNSHITAQVHNLGLVAPGIANAPVASNTIGTLNLDGNYTQLAMGTLQIELASTSSFDKLVVAGTAALDGTLQVELPTFAGFAPSAGDSFDLLTATGGITGHFASAQLPNLLGGLHGPYWTILYTNTDVILKLVNSPTGDYNHNGVVDAADYVVWRATLGKSVIPGQGADGNSSGIIDNGDYTVWRSHFGQTAGAGAETGANSAVPEPTMLVLLMFAAAGWRLQRRRAA
jgi:T5SS/PEP-CTERM-associated repeat protein